MSKNKIPWIPLSDRGTLPIPYEYFKNSSWCDSIDWEKFNVKIVPDETPLSKNWTDDVDLINPYENHPELLEMHKELSKQIIDAHAPPSTRWRRNYTDRSDWFWLWNQRND